MACKAYGLVDGFILADGVAQRSRVCVVVRLAGAGDGQGVRAEAGCDEDGGDLGQGLMMSWLNTRHRRGSWAHGEVGEVLGEVETDCRHGGHC